MSFFLISMDFGRITVKKSPPWIIRRGLKFIMNHGLGGAGG